MLFKTNEEVIADKTNMYTLSIIFRGTFNVLEKNLGLILSMSNLPRENAALSYLSVCHQDVKFVDLSTHVPALPLRPLSTSCAVVLSAYQMLDPLPNSLHDMGTNPCTNWLGRDGNLSILQVGNWNRQ